MVLIAAVLTLVEAERERAGARSALDVLLAGGLGALGAYLAAENAPSPPTAATEDPDAALQEVHSA